MTITEELILKVFKQFRTPRGGVLKPESLSLEIRNWNKPYQGEAFDARKRLIDGGYILIKGNRYVLTDKGYDYIYKDYSVSDTEKLILLEIRRRGAGVGNIIMTPWLNSVQREVEGFYSDNFNYAIRNLIDKGLIAAAEMGYKLTQEGYCEVYAEARLTLLHRN